jgi:cytochrome b6-f complex iron-sulfur subunit
MSIVTASRRRFLRVLAAGTAVGSLNVACSGSDGVGPDPIGDVQAGNIQDLSDSSLRAVVVSGRALPVAIGRDANGVYAMTLTCTHQGCNMGVNGSVMFSRVICTCHGSTFDGNGNVLGGKAKNPLVHFAVEIDASGNMTIHGDQEVAADTRTAVA